MSYDDKSSTYGELLTKDSSVTIHHRNIRALAIEIYKVIHGVSTTSAIMTFVEITFWREGKLNQCDMAPSLSHS